MRTPKMREDSAGPELTPLFQRSAGGRVLRVVVLQGGNSAEREVSLASGRAVCASLRDRGHAVLAVDPSATELTSLDWGEFDACFIALHGEFGEDGQVQQLLEDLGVPYTGSGPEASRLAMSKSATKERLGIHRLPTPPYFLVHQSDALSDAGRKADALGYPVFVKPDGGGSSIGVTRVEGCGQLQSALEHSFRWDRFAVVELGIAGRELTVAVVGRRALPLLEIRPTRSFFDYQAKYYDETTGYDFDSGLEAAARAALERLAVDVCAAIGTRGLCRVDMMLDEQLRPWVLELNTVPGMTSHSLAPMSARRAGISPALCEWLVLDCLAESERRPGAKIGA